MPLHQPLDTPLFGHGDGEARASADLLLTPLRPQSSRWSTTLSLENRRPLLGRWRVFARAAFELVPDRSERAFLWGDNVSTAGCSLIGEGYVHFHRPLNSPVLRAYIREAMVQVRLFEVTRYGLTFKTLEWPMDGGQVQEFVFEAQSAT